LPDLKVVSERPAAEIKKQKAAAKLGWALKELTANLIRVVRGAGKPEMIFKHVDSFVEAFARFCDETGEPPDPMLLRESIALPAPNRDDDRLDETLSGQAIFRHSLETVASELLQQRTQRDAAMNKLHDTLRRIEERRALAGKRKRKAKPRSLKSPARRQ
jgi:hypothetical protein